MKETGIIMSGNHPRLILDGIKTQTRRVIKPQPHEEEALEVGIYTPALIDKDGQLYPADYQLFGAYTLDGEITWKCPYGQVGDRLWVRETHFIGGIKPDEWAWYKAGFDGDADAVVWRPSIHMPRWASRITLEITDIRVERVQNITEEDALVEGITKDDAMVAHSEHDERVGMYDICYADAFQRLWDSLNAKRGYSWEVNPFVWVLSFRRLNGQG